jgi:hypothetical protein
MVLAIFPTFDKIRPDPFVRNIGESSKQLSEQTHDCEPSVELTAALRFTADALIDNR